MVRREWKVLPRPILYSNGEMIDLSSLIPASTGLRLESVVGINNRGQIAAYGVLQNGREIAVLLNPVTMC